MDARFSRLVEVSDGGSGRPVAWHLLDNGPVLDELGVTPVGTLLCVHGNPTWSYLWRGLVAAATDAATAVAESGSESGSGSGSGDVWRVIAVDQLEMGFSERTGTERPLERRVADLSALTNTLELSGPVVTVGHDWGGVVSMGWAVDHPDELAGVVLLNTAIHQPEDRAIPWPLRLTLQRGMLGRATVATPAFLETTLALAHPPLEAEVKNGYRAPYRSADRRGGIGAFVADIPVDEQHVSWNELERIAAGVRELGVPSLMLWGPRDPIFSDTYLDDLAERMPQADIHRFEGAGHMIAEDVEYAPVVLDWLGGIHSRSLSLSKGTDPVEKLPFDELREREPSERPLWSVLDELRDSTETALVDMKPFRTVSWRLLSRRVRQLAAGLVRAGVKPGDRVSLLIPPSADLTAVLYACLRIGAVVVVADAGLGLPGLTRAVRGARPDHVIGALPGLTVARAFSWPGQKISTTTLPLPTALALGVRHSLGEVARLGADEFLPEPPAASAVAAVLFTSGSTGPAKGVVYTHAQLEAVRDALSSQYDVGVGTGLVAGFAPFALLGPALGARSVTPDMNVTSPRTLTAKATARAAAAVDASVVFLSPAALANVVATADALDASDTAALAGVHTFLSAGAPVPESLLAAAGRLMPNATPHTPYGMTEGLLMTDITLEGIRAAADDAAALPDGEHAGGVCVGRPAGSVRVRIAALDDDGMPVGAPGEQPGVTGEIVLSAPHLKQAYDRLWVTNRVADADSVPAAAGEQGERWHRTGDVGHLDSAGRLWVEGRLPHVIVTAGGVITPVGPEQRIESLLGVNRAALAGIGPRGTQQLVAVLETEPAASRPAALGDSDLVAAVRHATALDIAAVLVVASLPTDIRHNSKIDRSALSRWAEGVLSGAKLSAP
ncbi:alpha/beta fold hydrolase [Agreia sp. PsM10]|uniref:alpha/beta fold hydrolase n=1 Tax=Agreia sp. PsM10 TaxID=3030533 RepID=UPI00263ADAAD|nr:alpha/beta fold hydrolase [Agreia sp. PsM10]MDN4639073.1 alpha/beta fold hydrolase [Agreia sp. PsM10]